MGKYIKTSERVQRANHGAAFKATSWTSYLPTSEQYRNNYDAIDWGDKDSERKAKPKRPKKPKKVPNPGTPEALALGCKCPVLDNLDAGGHVFYYSEDCKVHPLPAKKDKR